MNDKDESNITATQDEILTVDEAAAFLKLHKKTVYKLALAKKIPARRIGQQWRFSRSRLEEFLGVPSRSETETDKLKR
jgi:excisionase family DNA binding protein